jgi:hypothetical protein
MHATTTRRHVKPTRTIRRALPPSEVNPFAVVIIATGEAEDVYHVRAIPSDFGAAFEVEKVSALDARTYSVNLQGNGGTCECMGFLRWGHCRHVEGLHALRAAGKL